MYFLVSYGAEALEERELLSVRDTHLLPVPADTVFLIYSSREDEASIQELEARVEPLLRGADPTTLSLDPEPEQVFMVVALRRARGKRRPYVLVLLTPRNQIKFSLRRGDVMRIFARASSEEEANAIFEHNKGSMLEYFRDRQNALGIDPPISTNTVHPVLRPLLIEAA